MIGVLQRKFVPGIKLIIIFLLPLLTSMDHQDRQAKSEVGETLYNSIASADIPWEVVSTSAEGRNIYLLERGNGDSTTIFFGGFHGDELAGIQLVYRLAEQVMTMDSSEFASRVIIIPVLNPDGLVRNTRRNANGVDINRNFPTSDWTSKHRTIGNYPGSAPASEPETKAAIALLERYKPQRIVSVHTPLEMVNYNGPARGLATKMAAFNNYPVTSDVGYPTPGSFGTYAGNEKGIPTITLELPRRPFDVIWEENRKSLLEVTRYDSAK